MDKPFIIQSMYCSHTDKSFLVDNTLEQTRALEICIPQFFRVRVHVSFVFSPKLFNRSISHPYLSFKKITVFRKDVIRCFSLSGFIGLLFRYTQYHTKSIINQFLKISLLFFDFEKSL